MNEVEGILQHAERRCQAHGARLTTKRKRVLAGLIESNKALSAYELADLCKAQTGESIPAMSVYRILDFLEQERLVHKLKLANKYVACAHISCKHSHGVPQFLICNQCSSVKEISLSETTMAELESAVDQAGYRLLSPQLEMNCLCNQCAVSTKQ